MISVANSASTSAFIVKSSQRQTLAVACSRTMLVQHPDAVKRNASFVAVNRKDDAPIDEMLDMVDVPGASVQMRLKQRNLAVEAGNRLANHEFAHEN